MDLNNQIDVDKSATKMTVTLNKKVEKDTRSRRVSPCVV
jgi:hypothetical protein